MIVRRLAPGSLRGRRIAAAMREKPVHFEITDCVQGTTLGLSPLPNCPRLSHISLRGLLPRRLLDQSLEQQHINQVACVDAALFMMQHHHAVGFCHGAQDA
jgi:hypothetical protein